MGNSCNYAAGLEGVTVAETLLSDVDGENGILIVGGYNIEDIAFDRSFEDICWLLWTGKFPSKKESTAIKAEFGAARVKAFQDIQAFKIQRHFQDGMDYLRAAMSQLIGTTSDGTEELTYITAAMSVAASSWARLQAGHTPIKPDPDLSHATDYLRMLTGETASPSEATALNTYLVTVSDHGMNASTFSARVVASTGSDNVSSVVAAIGALKGPLHGGAPGPVLEMFDGIGEESNARKWLENEMKSHRRIMGMGHRVYRVRDPRAAVFEKAVRLLEKAGVKESRLKFARTIETVAEQVLAEHYPERKLRANVEFYTAVLLDALGLPRKTFTPTFAVGRVAGWCAHIVEQRKTGKLIRPASRYVGERLVAKS